MSEEATLLPRKGSEEASWLRHLVAASLAPPAHLLAASVPLREVPRKRRPGDGASSQDGALSAGCECEGLPGLGRREQSRSRPGIGDEQRRKTQRCLQSPVSMMESRVDDGVTCR